MKVLNIAHKDYEGYPIGAIKEFEFMGYKFFIHHSIDSNNLCISEYKTGRKILSLNNFLIHEYKEAIEAFVKLKFKSKKDFLAKLENHIETSLIINKEPK